MIAIKNTFFNRISEVTLISVVAIILGFILAETDLAGAAGLIALPIIILYLVLLFKNPRSGLYAALNFGFFANGMIRYSTAPFGLSIDIFLLITLIAALFKVKKEQSVNLRNPLVYAAVAW